MFEKYKYINVILPLAIPKAYSYRVPEEFWEDIQFGVRVEVPLRNKLLSGILLEEIEKPGGLHQLKSIRAVIDTTPIINPFQYKLWKWMSSYYLTTIGEVMNIALPSGLKLNSETKLISNFHIDDIELELNDKEYLLAEAISIHKELSISQAQDILQQKTVYPYIKSLLEKEILVVKEELKSGFKVKKADFIKLPKSLETQDALNEAFQKITRSGKQTKALLAYVQLSKYKNGYPKQIFTSWHKLIILLLRP